MGILGKIMDNFNASDFDISPNTKVNNLQKEFKQNFGFKIQIADKNDSHLVPNKKHSVNAPEENTIYRKINYF